MPSSPNSNNRPGTLYSLLVQPECSPELHPLYVLVLNKKGSGDAFSKDSPDTPWRHLGAVHTNTASRLIWSFLHQRTILPI